MSIDKEIKELAINLEREATQVGFVKKYPDELKERALVLHYKSDYSLNEFSKLIGKSTRTLKEWRIFLGFPKKKTIYANEHRIKNKEEHVVKHISKFIQTKEEKILAKKAERRIRNKEHKRVRRIFDAEKIKNVKKIIKINSEPKVDESVAKISYDFDSVIPIVVPSGDKISSKARKMQEEWLAKNTPKRYVYGNP